MSKKSQASNKHFLLTVGSVAIVCLFALFLYLNANTAFFSTEYNLIGQVVAADSTSTLVGSVKVIPPPVLDKAAYDEKMLQLANYPAPVVSTSTLAMNASTTASSTPSAPVVNPWPVKTVYPDYGALLPFNRIVAYYGNFYSTGMGVLGQYPAPEMLQKLQDAAAQWAAADPTTPVIPAIDYIAVTAQGTPGFDGLYRARMPDDQIQEAINLADQVHGIVILDIQLGLSDVQTEIPLLEKYLKLPEVHLALDPEFAMKKSGRKPGEVIGTMDASDINYVAGYLADLVKENNLPPKMLIIHTFTFNMLTNYQDIDPLPQVQIVMDMDGWGTPAKKIKIYNDVVADQPVQFTGIKLFYKNDLLAPSPGMMTPAEVLKLQPQPSYIQYQ